MTVAPRSGVPANRRPAGRVGSETLYEDAGRAIEGKRAPIKVLLIESQQLPAEALGFVLATDPEIEIVGVQVGPGVAAPDIRRAAPDVLVLDAARWDLAAPTIDALRAELPELKIIVLTTAPDGRELLAFIRAGVAGHVGKDRSPAELIRSIKQVHAGEVLFAPDLLVDLLRRAQHEPEPRPELRPLAPRELEVVRLLATGSSVAQVADRLGITVNTARSHLKKAMARLGTTSKLETVMAALRAGLIELPDGPRRWEPGAGSRESGARRQESGDG